MIFLTSKDWACLGDSSLLWKAQHIARKKSTFVIFQAWLLCTVEPRFNEVPRDWGNLLVISRFCSIHFTELSPGWRIIIVRYTEDFIIQYRGWLN